MEHSSTRKLPPMAMPLYRVPDGETVVNVNMHPGPASRFSTKAAASQESSSNSHPI
jgi:ribosomal protein L2